MNDDVSHVDVESDNDIEHTDNGSDSTEVLYDSIISLENQHENVNLQISSFQEQLALSDLKQLQHEAEFSDSVRVPHFFREGNLDFYPVHSRSEVLDHIQELINKEQCTLHKTIVGSPDGNYSASSNIPAKHKIALKQLASQDDLVI